MNILLTGKPGSGKSYLIQELIKELKEKNIAGIISPEIRDKERKGFKIIDLATKKEEILASVNIKSNIRVSKYKVNVNGINKIVDLFLSSFEKADYIFIDEIGKMELNSERFKEILIRCFDSDKNVIVTVMSRPHPFVDRLKARSDVKLLKVTLENRDKLAEDLIKKIIE